MEIPIDDLKRYLTFKYMLALGLIAVLSLTAYLTILKLIKTQEKSAALINISDRQRMLSQKSLLLSLQLVNTDQQLKRQQLNTEILKTADLIEKSHQGLLRGDKVMNLNGSLSPAVRAMYYNSPLYIDKQVQRYVEELRALAADSRPNITLENQHLKYLLTEGQGRLLMSLDLIVTQYQKESETEVARIGYFQASVLGLTMLVLLMEALFIFRPMVSKIHYDRVRIALANRELHKLSKIDGLTGIANRRFFDEFLGREWQHASRGAFCLSLIMIDIDFFKAYNDNYGHQSGDYCLQMVAKALSGTLKRATDVVFRYGGEEFAVLLANTDLEGAARVAESMRTNVEELQIPHNHSSVSKYVTISLGVDTVFPHRGLEPAALISAADQALYRAKQEGRNRCVCQTGRESNQ